jgi:hypothetical protein
MLWDSGAAYPTGMREEIGEFNACNFYIKSDTEFDLLMQVKDSAGMYAASATVHYKRGFWPDLPADWLPIALPFGPSGNYTVVSTEDPPPLLNWADLTEIGWVAIFTGFGAVGAVNIWFDGLRFVKPLVVNRSDSGATTRRSIRITKEAIVNYADAVIYALGALENQKYPQIYWSLDNIARVDIPTGQSFTYGVTSLLLREVDYTFSKDAGWKMMGTAWEKT